jgi:TonB-linked SusC/RagA family outer membrane protein
MFLLFLGSFIFAQQKRVTGKITGEDGRPVAGATVTARGTTISTLTGEDGSFTLNVPANVNRLVVTSVGFDAQEVAVGTGENLNVSMRQANSALNEVVVTGYTSQRRKDITGSVAVVNVNNMKQIPTGNVSQALQGQASGVTVLSSGQPGAGVNVMIRGITSIGSVAPLVIIDGTPGSLNNLNVDDIETMQVLKDAGSAAIYGVRGSNGVIVVTTKKGRAGRVRVNYDAYYGRQIPINNGENPFGIANTTETANAVFQSFRNSGLAFNHKQYGNSQTGPVIPDYLIPAGIVGSSPQTDPSRYALYDNQITRANKQGTDWFNEIFDAAPIQNHNLSLGTASDRSNFYLSLNYFNQQGTLMNTYLKRYSARINTTFNIGNRVRIGENAYFFYRQSPGFGNQNEGNAISHAYRQSPIIPVYDIMGNFAGTLSQELGNAQNPVAIMERTRNNKSNNYQVSGNVFGEVDFLRHFMFRTTFGGTIDNNYYNFFSFTAYENAENNRNPNAFQEGFGYNSSYTWNNTVTYNNVFAEKHNLKVLVGSEAIRNYGRGINGRRAGYFITNINNLTVDPSLWTLNAGPPAGQTTANDFGPYENTLYSLFSRLDYNFQDKYLLSGTIRRDGSSVFAKENRYGWFPSVSAGWRISREAFFPQSGWLNELKLRGSWGELGSISNINPTNAYSLYVQNAGQGSYDIGGTNGSGTVLGVYASQIGNTATTWEKDIITNVGLDATLFRNKLEFSVEWYKKSISGLLFRRLPDPVIQGPAQPFVNAGDIQNTGIDAQLRYNSNIGRDLTFNIGLSFTSYKNEVVALPAGRKYIDFGSAGSGRIGSFTRMQPGQSLGAFYGFEVLGLFQSMDDVAKSPTQEGAAPGRLKFRDVNRDGVITQDDRTFFGNPNPDFTAGFNLGLNYKGFDFSTFLYASVGNDVINYVRYWNDFPAVFNGAVSREAALNSARLVDANGAPTTLYIRNASNELVLNPNARVANADAKVPVLERAANFSTSTQFSSYYMEDGSFLKMRSLVLGYTLPNNSLRRYGIERLRIYVQGANLFTATKYTGLDPELINSDLNNNTNFGIDFGNYPANQKNFNFGINLTF